MPESQLLQRVIVNLAKFAKKSPQDVEKEFSKITEDPVLKLFKKKDWNKLPQYIITYCLSSAQNKKPIFQDEGIWLINSFLGANKLVPSTNLDQLGEKVTSILW